MMDKRKIKKLLILNLPYFLVGLFATNLGEAWRLAEGADSSAKMHCLKSLKRTIPMLLPILFHDGGKSITSRKNMPQHEPEKAERLRQRVQERLQKE